MTKTPQTQQRLCAKCWEPLEDEASPRRKYCDDTCAATARKRRQRNKAEADGRKEVDSVLAERNEFLQELTKTQIRLATNTNERRRYQYVANTADSNADKKIAFHGAAIATARQDAEEAQRVAIAARDVSDRLRDENANLRDQLRESLAKVELLRKRTPAKPKVQRTLATQVYFAFHQLAKDYREVRRGVELDDSDYRLFDQASRNRARLKLNGTDVDLRTLYYFYRLTTAAYQLSQQLKHMDANTTNNVKLFNIINKLIEIPDTLRPYGEVTHIPEPSAVPQEQS